MSVVSSCDAFEVSFILYFLPKIRVIAFIIFQSTLQLKEVFCGSVIALKKCFFLAPLACFKILFVVIEHSGLISHMSHVFKQPL